MNILELQEIAIIAEQKRVRIELHPLGFLIMARMPTRGKGMVESKQIVPYNDVDAFSAVDILKLFIDSVIEECKERSRK